jgi:hypothetical protein
VAICQHPIVETQQIQNIFQMQQIPPAEELFDNPTRGIYGERYGANKGLEHSSTAAPCLSQDAAKSGQHYLERHA